MALTCNKRENEEEKGTFKNFSSKKMTEKPPFERTHPNERSIGIVSFFSRLCFFWMSPLISMAAKRVCPHVSMTIRKKGSIIA